MSGRSCGCDPELKQPSSHQPLVKFYACETFPDCAFGRESKAAHISVCYDKKTGRVGDPRPQCCCASPNNHIERIRKIGSRERETVYAPPAVTVYEWQCPHCGCRFDL